MNVVRKNADLFPQKFLSYETPTVRVTFVHSKKYLSRNFHFALSAHLDFELLFEKNRFFEKIDWSWRATSAANTRRILGLRVGHDIEIIGIICLEFAQISIF